MVRYFRVSLNGETIGWTEVSPIVFESESPYAGMYQGFSHTDRHSVVCYTLDDIWHIKAKTNFMNRMARAIADNL